jgi:hypothetical protein
VVVVNVYARAAIPASMGVVVFSQEIGQCADIGAILAPNFKTCARSFISFECWRIEAHAYMTLKTIFRPFMVF